MSKQDELIAFLEAGEDLINGKYILADIKIVNLLKSIASSETLVALFKSSLLRFDYDEAKSKYLVQNKYFSGDRGEYLLPTSAKDILAFTFTILMDADAKRINLGEFINRYFYEDGSYSAGYALFTTQMIRPFVNTVKKLMVSVIEGQIEDPLKAIEREEERQKQEQLEAERRAQIEKELSQKTYAESVKAIKDILLDDKTKIKSKKIDADEVEQIILVIDKLANAIEQADVEQIVYSYVAYKYMTKAHKFTFWGRAKKIEKYLQDILNELYGKDAQ